MVICHWRVDSLFTEAKGLKVELVEMTLCGLMVLFQWTAVFERTALRLEPIRPTHF